MIASGETKREKCGDSVHAYSRDGKPQHSVPYKDKKRQGEFRPTTLRDIKENGWLPSVSSILGVMAKKGLDGWIKRQVAEAAWGFHHNGKMGGSTVIAEDWISAVLDDSESRMTKARDLGTEIHGAIERFLSGVSSDEPFFLLSKDGTVPTFRHSEHVEAAVAALKELGAWGVPFEAERTFASRLGYGGTIDFGIRGLIADFKCIDRLDKRLAYDDRCAQLCAYCIGGDDHNVLFEWQAVKQIHQHKLVNIFICTSEPGKCLIHEWGMEDKERGWTLFQQCFALWKTINRYDPTTHTGGTL